MTRKTRHFDARSRQSAIFEASVLVIVVDVAQHCIKNLVPFIADKKKSLWFHFL